MPYIRYLLSKSTNDDLKLLADLIQKKHPETFVSQLDPASQLGCHPFHITACAGTYSLDLIERTIASEGASLDKNPNLAEILKGCVESASVNTRMSVLILRVKLNASISDATVSMGNQFPNFPSNWYLANPHISLGRITTSSTYVLQSMFRVVADFFQSHAKDFQITGIEYETDNDAVANPAPYIFNTPRPLPQMPPHYVVSTDPSRTENYNNHFRNENPNTTANCSTAPTYNAYPNQYNQCSPTNASPLGGAGYQENRQFNSSFPANTSTTVVNNVQTSNIANDVFSLADSNACIICFTSPKSHAFIPCGHKCICAECQTRHFGVCPLCRTPVQLVIKIFDT